MPQAGGTGDTGTGNTAAAQVAGPRDEVQMLSLKADGTPDQYAPKLIGDPEQTRAATTEQFQQQAVSAVDQAERSAATAGTVVEDAPQDPTIADLAEKHDSAAQAAAASADTAVSATAKVKTTTTRSRTGE